MARVYTTTFLYNGESFLAVISQKQGLVSVYLPDEALHTIVPNGRLVFDPQTGVPTDVPPMVQRLREKILSAVKMPVI